MFLVLIALTAALCVAIYEWDAVTATALLMPLLVAVVLLSPRRLPSYILILLLLLLVETIAEYNDGDLPARRWVAITLLVATTAFTFYATASRAKLGVTGFRGDAILLDASERMNAQGRIPALPVGWYADVALRASGGTSFAGDFLVAHRSDDGRDFWSCSSTSPARASTPSSTNESVNKRIVYCHTRLYLQQQPSTHISPPNWHGSNHPRS